MKKEKILKIMLVIIMGIVLLGMSANVFALTDDDFNVDLTNTNTNTDTNTSGGVIDLTGTVNTNTNTNTSLDTVNTNTNTNINTTNSNYNTNLPKAGLAENTMAGVAVTVLTIVAIYAYRKIKYYKNI